jgi:hypothetical protein
MKRMQMIAKLEAAGFCRDVLEELAIRVLEELVAQLRRRRRRRS